MAVKTRDLGPCIIVWDPNGDNLEFKETFGGVVFRYEETRQEIRRDQKGETVVDEVTTGAPTFELEAPLTEPNLTKLVKCFANSASAANYLKVSNPVGSPVFASAKPIIVKPIVNGAVSTDENEWLRLHRTYPRINMELTYDNAGQRVYNTVFKGFPDNISGRQNELWRIGPSS